MPYLLTESSKPIIENIQNGGIAIFPTDTVYGIGCKMSNRGGVEEIYRLKNRPVNMSIAVLVNSIESASEIGKLDEAELKALEAFWPGALTVVVEAKTDVTIFGISSDNSVGLRYPNQQLISEIISVTGPLATTSLNLHGQKPVTQPVEVMEFIKATELNCKSEIPVILGGNLSGTPSTVVDIRQDTVKIIRSGEIDERHLIEKFKERL